jgi:hypothetical protein
MFSTGVENSRNPGAMNRETGKAHFSTRFLVPGFKFPVYNR